jgi:arginine N-succinyltransferase
MLVVRSVKREDLDSLFELIGQSEYGLTTLTISKERLESRIERSVQAFAEKRASPAGQPYMFVMEDLTSGKIVGTSAIYSKVGGFEPFYSYRIVTSVHESSELGIRKEIRALHLQEEHNGPTEIGSLFLNPKYWGHGHGRLLSFSRFLFMAEFPARFEKEIIAEMRGVVYSNGVSPLWSALGSHFFQIDFPKAETLTSESKKFIADLMPKHPIYIPLLPQEAQDVIGQVHPNTRPALALLEQEGFEFRNIVDIFDGGPAVHAATARVRSIRESQTGAIADIVRNIEPDSAVKPDGSDSDQLLVANCQLDFRCCLGRIAWSPSGAIIDEVTALRLKLKKADRVRTIALRPPPNTKSTRHRHP